MCLPSVENCLTKLQGLQDFLSVVIALENPFYNEFIHVKMPEFLCFLCVYNISKPSSHDH